MYCIIYMKMITGVINVDENIDSKTVNDFGCEPFAKNQYNYMKMAAGAIIAIGITEHETISAIGMEWFIGNLNNDDECAVAAAAVLVTDRNNFAYNKNLSNAGSEWIPAKGKVFGTKTQSFFQFPDSLEWGVGKTLNRPNKNNCVKTANMPFVPSGSSMWLQRSSSMIRSSLVEWT